MQCLYSVHEKMFKLPRNWRTGATFLVAGGNPWPPPLNDNPLLKSLLAFLFLFLSENVMFNLEAVSVVRPEVCVTIIILFSWTVSTYKTVKLIEQLLTKFLKSRFRLPHKIMPKKSCLKYVEPVSVHYWPKRAKIDQSAVYNSKSAPVQECTVDKISRLYIL